MITIFASLFASQSYAGQLTSQGTITRVTTGSQQQVRVSFSAGIINPDGCQASNFYILELKDDLTSQRLYSAVLTANASKQKVSFFIHSCASFSGKTYPKIHAVHAH